VLDCKQNKENNLVIVVSQHQSSEKF